MTNDSDATVRLRGDLSDPISTSTVRAAKRRVIETNAESERASTIGVEDVPDHHHIVAFNFDVLDGTPTSWVGVVGDPSVGRRTPDSLAEVRQQRVEYVHAKARRNAQMRAERKQTDSTTTNSVTTQSTTEDWADWNMQASDRHEIVGSNGNETGYDIKWKADPDNYAHQGVETELRLLPQETDMWTDDWKNEWADPYYQFNDSVIDKVSDYGPGNSVGTVTNTISLAVTSSKTVEVGASTSNTSSNVDIDNHSDTYGGDNYVNQKFTISGDLQWNTVRVNQSACTKGTYGKSGADYCNMDLDAKYRWGDSLHTSKHEYDFRLYWK